jgi:FKBP-type peptidyl-prolyl cis-trans isomerase FklB
MYLKIFAVLLLSLIIASCGEKQDAMKSENLPYPDSLMDKFSYALGHDMGLNTRRDSIKINLKYYIKGYIDGHDSDYKFMKVDSMEAYKAKFSELMSKKKEAQMKVLEEKRKIEGEKIKGLGEKFLADNKSKTGVKTTPSGLQYRSIKSGKGTPAKDGDIVKVNFLLKTIEGKEIQNTFTKQEPIIAPVTDLLPGWREAMYIMKPGDRFELVLPPTLAFGDRGLGDVILPNAPVILEVEYIAISSQEEMKEFQQKMMQKQMEMQKNMKK